MSDVADNIKVSFQSFINEGIPYNFFVGLADYVKYVRKVDEAKAIIEELERQWLIEYKRLDEYEVAALAELQKPIDEVLGLKNYFIDQKLEPVIKAITKVENLLSG